ncbi:MAG: hypothetical protein KIT25_15305 [Enhydrobacter sp.]|nr:MAG: hypothetical protein KIT25_15305 [Enhydrobacter sp.]
MAALLVAAGAAAQTPGQPQEFRDPKTGQIWTPDNVGQDKGPVKPEDRAFDPSGQAVAVEGVVQQNAATTFVSSIPVTAGPTVPLVEIDDPTLRAIPGSRWRVAVDLSNNAATTFSPVIECLFTNGGRKVETTRAIVPPTPGGTRWALTLYGPRSDIFVDLVTCRVAEQ